MLMIETLQRIDLGIRGENQARGIQIDCNAWKNLYPNGTISIFHKRPGETTPGVTGSTWDAENGILTWVPSEYDTYYAGNGEAEIRCTEGTVTRKTAAVETLIRPDVVNDAGQTVASNWDGYIGEVERLKNIADNAREVCEEAVVSFGELLEIAQRAAADASASLEETVELSGRLTRLAEEVEERTDDAIEVADDAADEARTAREMATNAQQAATQARNTADQAQQDAAAAISGIRTAAAGATEAAESAGNSKNEATRKADEAAEQAKIAEAWAVGQRGGVNVPATDPAYHNNAKYYAGKTAEDRAATSRAEQVVAEGVSAAQAAVGQAQGHAQAAETAADEAREAAQEAAETVVAAQGPGILYVDTEGIPYVLE